jgi:hypothetical protein
MRRWDNRTQRYCSCSRDSHGIRIG